MITATSPKEVVELLSQDSFRVIHRDQYGKVALTGEFGIKETQEFGNLLYVLD